MKKERIITPEPGGRYGLADWHTHLTLLSASLFRQRPKSILELGIGDYSTALIHAYVQNEPGSEAFSVENNFHPGWFEGLQWMNSPSHHICKRDEWNYDEWPGPYDFVFVDHGPESERIPALDYYQSRADVVMIHDCNYPERYGAILDRFDYVLHDRTHRFFTTVASTKHDVTTWL